MEQIFNRISKPLSYLSVHAGGDGSELRKKKKKKKKTTSQGACLGKGSLPGNEGKTCLGMGQFSRAIRGDLVVCGATDRSALLGRVGAK